MAEAARRADLDPRSCLIVVLDLLTWDDAEGHVATLADSLVVYKIGLELI